MKIWQGYFSVEAAGFYEYRNENAERKFVKQIAKRTFIDLKRKWGGESGVTESLDSPFKPDSTMTLGDTIGASDRVEEEVVNRVIAVETLKYEAQTARSDLTKLMVTNLIDGTCAEQMQAYSANHIAVTKHHLRRAVEAALSMS